MIEQVNNKEGVPKKICTQCKEEKELKDSFYKRPSNVDGYNSICKKCYSDMEIARLKRKAEWEIKFI